jgi:CTP:molybdopterin cytidylyltransferase MocA
VNVAVTLIQSQRPPAERRRSDLTRVAALVLAAGSSTRFGEPKPFALFQGETFIKRIVTAAIEADWAPVVVVTGEDSKQVTSELTGLSVSIAMNPGWSSGWIVDSCGCPTGDGSRSLFSRSVATQRDSGAKKIILARPHDVVSFDFPAGAIDIDTAADYKKLYQPLAADGTRLG